MSLFYGFIDEMEKIASTRFARELEKTAKKKSVLPEKSVIEYSPGIPVKNKVDQIRQVKKPEFWPFVIQKHLAERRGKHYDLRVGDPKFKKGHSWVLPSKLPKPGEYIDIPRTETHTLDYFKFKGKIPKGSYGAGDVKPVDEGKVEVYKSSPERLSFILHKGGLSQRFTLVGEPEGKKWRLVNHTPTRQRYQLPTKKNKVKTIKEAPIGERYAYTPKLRGAHGVIDLPKSKSLINTYSYRVSKKNPNLPIDHTLKYKNYHKMTVPPGLGGTRLRGEIMAVDKKGNPLDEQKLGGLLNSGVLNSREKQKQLGVTLKTFIYNIDKYRGRDVSDKKYEEKESLLKQIIKKLPRVNFSLLKPEYKEKKQKELMSKILGKEYRMTDEGVVIIDKEKNKIYRYKSRPDTDVYVRKIFQEKDKSGNLKGQAGGFYYSKTPKGKIIGKVGTGFSHNLKREMWRDQNRYIGRAAKVTADRVLPSGVLFQPAFTGDWHIEKGKQ